MWNERRNEERKEGRWVITCRCGTNEGRKEERLVITCRCGMNEEMKEGRKEGG